MNVLVFASRKGGSGKSTLAAHLATYLDQDHRRILLIDLDPQGSLALWHALRGEEEVGLKVGGRQLAETLRKAKADGYQWVLIDTPPNKSSIVAEAISHATMVVIPMRPGLFDLAAVQDTMALCREMRKPYAVVINGAPPKRGNQDAPSVADARGALAALKAPVWAGQITHNHDTSLALAHGEGVKEYSAKSSAAEEIGWLWMALDRSVEAIQGAYKKMGKSRAA
jgi:chromosome partitioning protein